MATLDERVDLVCRNLAEVMGSGRERIKKIMAERELRIYWGTATTGKPHIGYFVPLAKIADFLRAGCHVTILFADLHAFLDNLKAPWELLKLRASYYEVLIKAMLESIGVPLDKLEFVLGTSFQLSKEYTLDVYKLTSIVTERNAKKAGAEVVKQVASPLLSGLVYPLLQALDEVYLKCDAQFGGVDQRKIFTFAEENLPRIGYQKRIHLMNPMVPSLQGKRVKPAEGEEKKEQPAFEKMSASDANSKIDCLDSVKQVKKKINTAFCEEGNVEQNGVLEFARLVLFPTLKDGKFRIERPEKYGGNLVYENYADLHKAYAEKALHPGDLKKAVATHLNALLEPVRAKFLKNPELKKLTSQAYPTKNAKNANGDNKKGKKAPKNQPKKVCISRLDLRVGKIVEVKAHDGADSLFIERIDVGEGEPWQIVSGIRAWFKPEDLLNRNVLVACNMKPNMLKGVKSFGMIMAASVKEEDGTEKCELLEPHPDSKPGDRIFCEGMEGEPDNRINSKTLKKLFPDLKTDDKCVACFKGVPFRTKLGVVTVKTLTNSRIK